jgi:acetolactate synthase-1/2/3 large subunit
MKSAEAIAEILKQEGVEFLFGYPNNPIIEAAAKSDIRPVIVRQERTGIHMADALSRVSSGNRIGVFAMQLGPGAENSFGGVAQAYADSVPILVLPAGYPRHLNNVAPNFSSFLSYRHITKSIEQVTSAATIPDVMRRAFTQVRNGRLRPVMVEIPFDIFADEVPGPLNYIPTVLTRSAPEAKAVTEVARVLRKAKRPIIYVGQGVHYSEGWKHLLNLAELLSAPVMTSLQGKSAFPEDHPLSLGCGGLAFPKTIHHFLSNADVILGIGCSFTATSFGVSIPSDKVTIIHATLDTADLNKNMRADYALVGDAKLTLESLLSELKDAGKVNEKDTYDKVAHEIKKIREEWMSEWMDKLTSDEVPITPYRVIWDLMHIVDPARTIITHDAGSPRDQLSPFWVTTAPLTYLGWGKSTQLGYSLGLIMGAKLAEPTKLCINVMGDAAIGFTGMDFETAVREHIPILTIVFNNFCMAITAPKFPIATKKYRSTEISGNYAEMAKAFGGYAERITFPADVSPAIKRAIQKTEDGTPALLEFITARETHYSIYK